MAISPSRTIAHEVLRRVEKEAGYASDLLHVRLGAKKETPAGETKRRARDASLATELTLGTLRWQRLLDFLLEKHANRLVSELDVEVRVALRLGMYQLRFLTRVPARAAVDESVELVKKYGKRSAAGLVNAVLRRIAAEQAGEKGPLKKLNLAKKLPVAERLGIEWSHPTWMVERWLEQLGRERTIALLEANNRAPRLCCSLHDSGRVREVAAELRNSGMKVEAGRWLRAALAIAGGNPSQTDVFRRGEISIQDEASQMVARLLNARAGDRALDLCAAPGGKTIPVARQAGTTGFVVAAELHQRRLMELRDQLRRVGAHRVALVRLDGTAWLPFRQAFDRVLLDAPCSGTGTLARNPEIRWRLRPDDLRDFHGRQVRLLANALEQLKAGGRLVYSTCSLEPEENEDVVEEVLTGRTDVHRSSGEESLRPHLVEAGAGKRFFDDNGYFRTLPGEHGTDGFFAAVLERD